MKGDFTRLTFRPAKHYSGVLQQQGRVTLDADFNEHAEIERYRLRTLARDLVGPCGGPKGSAGFEITVDHSGGQLVVGAGHYYVDGLLVANEDDCRFDRQPDLPTASAALAQALGTPGRYLAYLDVWERVITAVEDPDLLEVALGGADTSVRLKVVWQVRLTPLKHGRHRCGAVSRRRENRATLDMRPQSVGYTGLENRLYRIEVDSVDDAGNARFKWSRDNASLAMPLAAIDGTLLTLRNGQPNSADRLATGGWLELLDDAIELEGKQGQLVQIAAIAPAEWSITLTAAAAPLSDTATGVEPSLHPKARHWHAVSYLASSGKTADWVALEDGIQVRVGGGSPRPGDYWIFPARTADSSVEQLQQVPAGSIEHQCCPLAVVEIGARRKAWRIIEDRRRLLAPLTG